MDIKQLEKEYELTKQQIKDKLTTIKDHLSQIEQCKMDIDQLGARLSEIQTTYSELTNQQEAAHEEKK